MRRSRETVAMEDSHAQALAFAKAHEMEAVLSEAVNEVLRTRPNRPFKALAAHLKAADARLQGSDDDDDGESAARHADVPSHINTDGRRQKRFCELRAAVRSSRALLPAAAPKRVLCVIDVMDGYDNAFLSSLDPKLWGSLGFIRKRHDVLASYELTTSKVIRAHAKGELSISYDKGWNRGLDGGAIERVCERAVSEIESGGYDAVRSASA